MKSLADALYGTTRKTLKIPTGPLDPNGEAVIRAFQPAPRYAGYRLLCWAFTQLSLFIPFAIFLLPNDLRGFLDQIGFDWIRYIDHNSQWQENIPGPLQFPARVLTLGGYVFQLVFSFLGAFLSAKAQAYLLTDRSIRIRRGLGLYKEITLSLRNIQQVKISQNPLERLWGIGTLEVRTAGGGAASKKDQKKDDKSHTGELVGLIDPFALRELVNEAIENASSPMPAIPNIEGQTAIDPALSTTDLKQAVQELTLASQSLREAITNRS